MTDLTIQVDNQQVNNALDFLGGLVSDMQPAMESIGQVLATNIRLGFRDMKSPDGVNWKALSPTTISRRRNQSDQPLNDTGVLKNSFSVQAAAQSVVVGTNALQAAMMNFGGTKAQFPHLWGDIPARPFMPTSKLQAQWEKDIVEIIKRHIEQHL